MPTPQRVPLAGSRRQLPSGARFLERLAVDERIEITLLLRRRQPLPPLTGAIIPRAEFAGRHGAHPDDLQAVRVFLEQHGLEILHTDPARRVLRAAGPAGAANSAFGVALKRYRHAGGRFHSHTEPVSLPEPVAPLIEAVLGLDTRVQARPHFRRRPRPTAPQALTPVQVARLYQFPADLDGTGQCIGILELGGGYRPEDLQTYFTQLGLPVPAVTAVSVLGATNAPDGPTRDANGEVMLDIEVAGAVAPRAGIVVYFAPNTDQGFLQGLSTAIHDAANHPSVVSISWGAAESEWSAQAIQALDSVCQDAAALGVTILVAAGDNGASDLPKPDGKAHADFPASSPHVLACGGTHLEGASAITLETVWNDGPSGGATGGGISTVFPLPDFQQAAHVPPSINPGHQTGRGVPDVAGNADPATGYIVRVDGAEEVVGGTSAVAPLWAGLLALLNQARGQPIGFVNPGLYTQASAAGLCRDVTVGNNGGYDAGPGWDPCTGWGSPQGDSLRRTLAAAT